MNYNEELMNKCAEKKCRNNREHKNISWSHFPNKGSLFPPHLMKYLNMLDLCTTFTRIPLLQSSNINIKPMMDFEYSRFKLPFSNK